MTAYIFDSHRPYSINNVNDETKRIYCVDDGCKSFAECPTAQDVNDYLDLQQQQDSDEDSDDEDDSQNSDEQNAQEGKDEDIEEKNEDLDS